MSGLFGTHASLQTDIALIFVVLSALFGVLARYYIIKKKPFRHMLFNTSGVILLYIFLIFYLYNYLVNGVLTFGGTGFIQWFYYIFLIIHMVSSALNGFFCTILALRSLIRFDNSQENEWKKFPFDAIYRSFHKRIGKLTFLLWIFSAVSGVMVYILLYIIYPPAKLF